MPQLYEAPPTPSRLVTIKSGVTLDLHALRVLADNLADLPAPVRVVAPRDLDPCSGCDEDPDWPPAPSVAEIRYQLGTVVYAEPVCELHIRPAARWHRRCGTPVLAVAIPAPLAHLCDATDADGRLAA